jgi:hypothetical protein
MCCARRCDPYSDVLQADYEHVWLTSVDVEMDPGGDPRAEFFEDAPRLGEAARTGCGRSVRPSRPAGGRAARDGRGRPRGAGHAGELRGRAHAPDRQPGRRADDVRAAAVAERITNMMQETFRANGFVETYDLRDVQTNQLEGRSPDSVSHPPVLAEVRVSRLGQELQATIVARVPATGG